MKQDRTYYFIIPHTRHPVGGTNVLIEYADVLHQNGYDTALLFGSQHYTYEHQDHRLPTFYDDALLRYYRKLWTKDFGSFVSSVKRVAQKKARAQHNRLVRKPTDTFVIPEYIYPELLPMFSGHKCILEVQDVFGFSRAFARDCENERLKVNSFDAYFATSEASHAILNEIAGIEAYRTSLSVEKPGLQFTQKKRKQIAYMPRKRPEEADIVAKALKRTPELSDFTFKPIIGMSNVEVANTLNESLIFLSFSDQEGFGLPAAEAMLAGCIVIGYTGVGGDEYFNSDVGYPIQDSDIGAFLNTVKSVASAYDQDPKPLDLKRRHASDCISKHYNRNLMTTELKATWSAIRRDLASLTS